MGRSEHYLYQDCNVPEVKISSRNSDVRNHPYLYVNMETPEIKTLKIEPVHRSHYLNRNLEENNEGVFFKGDLENGLNILDLLEFMFGRSSFGKKLVGGSLEDTDFTSPLTIPKFKIRSKDLEDFKVKYNFSEEGLSFFLRNNFDNRFLYRHRYGWGFTEKGLEIPNLNFDDNYPYLQAFTKLMDGLD